MVVLDDNQISINGIRHNIDNKWDEDAKINLYSVESNDNGFHLNIGENIPVMKKIIHQSKISEVDELIKVD